MDSPDPNQLPLLPPPRWPEAGSHCRRVLDLLLTGKPITSADYIAAAGSWKLASRISELRRWFGWPVHRELIPNPAGPKGPPIACYSLPAEVLACHAPRS